jgi:hypothetical protein
MKFEGEEIDGARIVIRQFKGEWELEDSMTRNEIVELRVKAKVKDVSFEENLRTGDLNRTHILWIEEAEKV